MRQLHRQNFSGLIAIDSQKEGDVNQDIKDDVEKDDVEIARRLAR